MLFEVFSIVILGLELVFAPGVAWDDVFWFSIMAWIVWAVSRRKSAVARWVFTALFAIGFALAAFLATRGTVPLANVGWAGWLTTVAAIVQMALLWSPVMSQWIASKADDNQRTGAKG